MKLMTNLYHRGHMGRAWMAQPSVMPKRSAMLLGWKACGNVGFFRLRSGWKCWFQVGASARGFLDLRTKWRLHMSPKTYPEPIVGQADEARSQAIANVTMRCKHRREQRSYGGARIVELTPSVRALGLTCCLNKLPVGRVGGRTFSVREASKRTRLRQSNHLVCRCSCLRHR